MMLKPTLAVAAAAAVVVPLASAHAAPSRTLTLTARLDRHSLVQVDNGRKGRSAGDEFIFSAALRRDGRADGRAEFVQTAVDNRYRGISVRADLLLRDGTLELQGAGTSRRPPGGAKPTDDLAVVGGTGAYAGASGTVRMTNAGPTSQRLQISLAS